MGTALAGCLLSSLGFGGIGYMCLGALLLAPWPRFLRRQQAWDFRWY